MWNPVFRWTEYIWSKIFNFKEYSSLSKPANEEERVMLDKLGKCKGDMDVSPNIYGYQGNHYDYIKKQNVIHQFFKYLFLVPLLALAKTILGKHLVTNIQPNPQYYNLWVFDQSFDKTTYDWADRFIRSTESNKNKKHIWERGWLTDYLSKGSATMLTIMKSFILTVCMNDTAYMEYLNMLMYNITIKMNESYKTKTVNHLFYTGNTISDMKYFVALNSKHIQECRSHQRTIDSIPGEYKIMVDDIKVSKHETPITPTKD